MLQVRNATERQRAVRWIQEENRKLVILTESLATVLREGETPEDVLIPLSEGIKRQEEIVATYDTAKVGGLPKVAGLQDLGAYLIAARVMLGLSLKQFGRITGIHYTQLGAYERTGYKTVGLLRAQAILDKIGAKVTVGVSLEEEPTPKAESQTIPDAP